MGARQAHAARVGAQSHYRKNLSETIEPQKIVVTVIYARVADVKEPRLPPPFRGREKRGRCSSTMTPPKASNKIY
jgi:hypothetical protein